MINEKDLVALVWASNNCYTKVVEPSCVSEHETTGGEMDEPRYTWKWAKLEFDLEKGTWKHGKKYGNIGRGYLPYGFSRYGLVGIYDRTNIKHLDAMVHDAMSAVNAHGGAICVD
jgi:hypothetical protein